MIKMNAVALRKKPPLGPKFLDRRWRRGKTLVSHYRVGKETVTLRRNASGVRYITSDPIGIWADLNTYNYVSGNVLNFHDINGLAKVDINSAKRLSNWVVKKFSRIGKDEAKRRLRRGGDVMGSNKQMKKLQKEKGKKPIKEQHGDGKGTEHWHKGDRDGGHGFVDPQQKGAADPGILPWLIPWWLTPTEIGCAALDCDGDGEVDDPEWTSPDPVDDDIYDKFCRQNPSAPNCANECQ